MFEQLAHHQVNVACPTVYQHRVMDPNNRDFSAAEDTNRDLGGSEVCSISILSGAVFLCGCTIKKPLSRQITIQIDT